MIKQVSFSSSNNIVLAGDWQYPATESKKVIILVHGITVDRKEGGVFDKLASFLVENGYVVFRFDFRGIGESTGESVDMTVQGEMDDLESAVSYVQSQGYSDISILAASFGAGVTALLLPKIQEKIRSVCMWYPGLDFESMFLNPSVPWIKDDVSAMKKEIDEQGWTTLGRRNFVIGKKLWEEFSVFKPYENLSKIFIPTLMIHGDSDSFVPYADSEKYAPLLQNGKFITITDGEHGFWGEENGEKIAYDKTLNFLKKNIVP